MRILGWAPSLLALAACTGNDPAILPGDGGAPPSAEAGPRERTDPPALPVTEVLGDGSSGSTSLVTLFRAPSGWTATDLEFNPERPRELWVVLRAIHDGTPCNQPPMGGTADPSCDLLGGGVAILSDADTAAPEPRVDQDPNAWHFMRLPPAIAFGPGDTFATCGEARTGNWDDEPADYIGPTLWSSDPEIFAIQPPGQNGSHLDMLHATPFCMGIAHEKASIYWLMNGDVGALDRYDFHDPHRVGGADHSDGEASRWVTGELERVPGIPSHLAYDPRDGALYAADTGHGRVVRLDTTSGALSGTFPTYDEQMPEIGRREGATLTDLVPPGTLEAPSGIALVGDTLYVTDNRTSVVTAFDLSGNEKGSFDTGLPAGTLAGIAIGPDGKAYLADLVRGLVRRVEPE